MAGKWGREKTGGEAKTELSGAEEALGLGDCCAFILLCRGLLKHYLKKRLKSRVDAALR